MKEHKPAGIKIKDLNLAFGDTEVLKGVNLEIEPGEFFAFLGPSGSGKSTLLRAIAGFGPQPNGKILIDGEDILALPPWKRNVGMVFQNYALWPHMTVWKNVAYGLEERKLNKKVIAQKVDEVLELVDLKHLANRRPSQLSGGQQQRIALARTLVIEPKVLLLDEPLSNLDANLRVQMRREILSLQRQLGITTIFVTHDQEEANTTSNRIAVLNDGIVQQVGKPVELYDHPKNLFVADFLGTANILLGKVHKIEGKTFFVSDKQLKIRVPETSKLYNSLIFRPQSVDIFEEGTVVETNNRLMLTGTVITNEFLGSIVRYIVDVSGHQILIDETHRQDKPLIANGKNVDLYINNEEINMLGG
jgi:iron(III) transport system ATP-binding protein